MSRVRDEDTALSVALAQLVLGEEHSLVCLASSSFCGGCTEAELLRATRLEMSRMRFILWDLHNNGFGVYRPPIFTATPDPVLEEAVQRISCAKERGRFYCALQGTAVGISRKRSAPDPVEE